MSVVCIVTLTRTRRWSRILALLLPLTQPLLLPPSASAAPEGWVALTPAALSALRGGFSTPQGLHLALGIEQLASVNGQLVARNALVLPPAGADVGVSRAGSTSMLLQLGAGNAMPPDFAAQMPAAMVIQNTLNAQSIDTTTIITASVNSRSLIDTLNFQSHLSDALARAATAQ